VQVPEIIGRYALYEKIAAGGMATVHIGRLLGPVGFSRTVAIKRMHPQFTGDPEFVSMFLDEARLAARVRHPNVVSTLDVVATNGELFLVLDYVQGETLSLLCRRAAARDEKIPVGIAAAILSGVLHGLHAAHEAKNERGEPLGIVHRDVSPQNVIVGVDGISRVLDFGVAKAAGRLQTTHAGKLKGKLAYMPAEQLMGEHITRRSDIYAASIVLWEALTGLRLFVGENDGAILQSVLNQKVERPSKFRSEVPPALDTVVMRGLARNPADRFATARDMATALEAAVSVAIPPAVGAWVDGMAAETLSAQAERIARIESASDSAPDLAGVGAVDAVRRSAPDVGGGPLSSSGAGTEWKPDGAPDDVPTRTPAHFHVIDPTAAAPTRSTRMLAVGAVVVALTATAGVVALQRREPAPAQSSAQSASPSSPPLASVAAPPPPSVSAAPSASTATAASASAAPAVAAPPKLTPVESTRKRAPAPPAGAAPAPPPGAAPAPGVPGYDPRDHL
jgi:serine/threonine-protein kinase